MSIFDTLKSLIGKPHPSRASTPTDTPPDRTDYARLEAHWSSVGTVEPDVLGHLISPSLMGGPAWPTTRQAYRVVRRDGGVIVATDGMSDAFNEADLPDNGFGMELFLETRDIAEAFIGTPGSIATLSGSWAFAVVSHVAQIVANAGGIVPQLERYGVMSVELPGFADATAIASQVPAHFVTSDGSLGLLIGGPAPDFSTLVSGGGTGPVQLVPIVVLTGDELEFVRANGAAARLDVAERLTAAGSAHRSDLTRHAVV